MIRNPMRANFTEPFKHQIDCDVGDVPCVVQISKIGRTVEKVFVRVDEDNQIDCTAELMERPEVEEAVQRLNVLLDELP